MLYKKRSIFERQADLKSSQIYAVAERRFCDAKYLLDSGQNARLNAAMYLCGFTVECLLKARLLEKLEDQGKFGINDAKFEQLRKLVYRSHDLNEMLAEIPELELQMEKARPGDGKTLFKKLKVVCSLWTIYARYSPQQANRAEATEFLLNVREIKTCLQNL